MVVRSDPPHPVTAEGSGHGPEARVHAQLTLTGPSLVWPWAPCAPLPSSVSSSGINERRGLCVTRRVQGREIPAGSLPAETRAPTPVLPRKAAAGFFWL